MALPRVPIIPIPAHGLEVASPDATHGVHTFRSSSNFNTIVDNLSGLVTDHAGSLGNIQFIKEWWEDPAIVGESEELPCVYILPLYISSPHDEKTDDDNKYKSSPYIGDPLARTVFPVTVMAYYKYTDVRQPLRAVRNYGWNFWDILLDERRDYGLPAGVQAMTPHVGWHMAGTQYIIQWWSMQMRMTAIL